MTESFETIDEPKAKSESEARSFCEISEIELKRRLSLTNRTSYLKKASRRLMSSRTVNRSGVCYDVVFRTNSDQKNRR